MARGIFGERLKRERELREVSLEEVAKSTRIGTRFLQALENEQWEKLPGGIFNRGFVRAIAHYLGLSEEDLLSEYDVARAEQKTESPVPQENGIPRPSIWIPIAAVLFLLCVMTALVYGGRYGWRRYAAYRAAKHPGSEAAQLQTPPPSSNGSNPVAEDPASPSTMAALDLSVSTSAATRVRVLADGKLQLDADLPAGETRHFSANQQFEVTAGDSSAVLLELNGQAMPPLGAPGASGTIVLSQKDLRQGHSGTSQP
jgi:cytoskeletal protein RodZ